MVGNLEGVNNGSDIKVLSSDIGILEQKPLSRKRNILAICCLDRSKLEYSPGYAMVPDPQSWAPHLRAHLAGTALDATMLTVPPF